jgi:hypothetical protein
MNFGKLQKLNTASLIKTTVECLHTKNYPTAFTVCVQRLETEPKLIDEIKKQQMMNQPGTEQFTKFCELFIDLDNYSKIKWQINIYNSQNSPTKKFVTKATNTDMIANEDNSPTKIFETKSTNTDMIANVWTCSDEHYSDDAVVTAMKKYEKREMEANAKSQRLAEV